jgi:uncharacterized protein YndB with AHSA1/START domain
MPTYGGKTREKCFYINSYIYKFEFIYRGKLMKSPKNLIDNVEREVVSMDWEGKPARAVITHRTYATDIEDLWDAIVDPERLKSWFMPITGDLCEGGHYQLEDNAGGKIIQCDAPVLLAITWEMNGGIGWLNVKLSVWEKESTRLTLEHIAHEEEDFLAFWEQFGPGSLGVGWDLGLFGLTEYLACEGELLALGEEAWIKTEEGRDFAQVSSDAWVAAAVAFGTDSQLARVSGERTLAFYTGGTR